MASRFWMAKSGGQLEISRGIWAFRVFGSRRSLTFEFERKKSSRRNCYELQTSSVPVAQKLLSRSHVNFVKNLLGVALWGTDTVNMWNFQARVRGAENLKT